MFGGRWLVQFLASRRARRPVIPRLFWHMSLLGSAMTLRYFLFSAKQDSVGVLQNLFPTFTAGYMLWLDLRHPSGSAAAAGADRTPGSGDMDAHCAENPDLPDDCESPPRRA